VAIRRRAKQMAFLQRQGPRPRIRQAMNPVGITSSGKKEGAPYRVSERVALNVLL